MGKMNNMSFKESNKIVIVANCSHKREIWHIACSMLLFENH